MKKLILVRHATAVAHRFSSEDFDRPLEATGLREARKLGEYIAASGISPEHIVFSSAARTVQTAGIITEILGTSGLHQTSSMILYNAGFQVLLQYVQHFSDDVSTLLLVAHNPGISQLATALSGANPYQFSTACGLCLRFEDSLWKNIRAGNGKEIWYFNP